MNSPRRLSSVLSTEDVRLSCFDVEVFHLNQRQSLNPLYNEIKESILAKGVQEPIHAVFHPDLNQWVLSQGGQTRLLICRELYESSKDEMFLYPPIIRKKFTSDLDLVVSHLVENHLRGENSFLETSNAVINIRRLMGQSDGGEPTQEALADEMESRGLPIRRQSITSMVYLSEHLAPKVTNKEFLTKVSRKAIDSIRALRKELSETLSSKDFDQQLIAYINEHSGFIPVSKILTFFKSAQPKPSTTPRNNEAFASQLSKSCGLGEIICHSDTLYSGFYVSLPERVENRSQAEMCFLLASLSGAFEDDVGEMVHDQMGLQDHDGDLLTTVRKRLNLNESDLLGLPSRIFFRSDEESFEALLGLIAGVRTTFHINNHSLEKQ